jgi:hypothetical protein
MEINVELLNIQPERIISEINRGQEITIPGKENQVQKLFQFVIGKVMTQKVLMMNYLEFGKIEKT